MTQQMPGIPLLSDPVLLGPGLPVAIRTPGLRVDFEDSGNRLGIRVGVLGEAEAAARLVAAFGR
jgi:hypothetical protein